ncbi:hypothetical protein GUJ93_ZPchr0009g1119 [Zizania palustris]|uniref:Purple acid phosphatase Fn3-like domain-containing protein n=1 Tax=Zizania palustris TaxID=103762 RepID=A0A8J5RN49_ZIZPA|nr:hypothetical protein GUJ93_ZPchr0009g1119 [Zizania palustris]
MVAAVWWAVLACVVVAVAHGGVQPLSRIAMERATVAADASARVKARPTVLGLKGESSDWVVVEFFNPKPSDDDWIGVFSPSEFSSEICQPEYYGDLPPLLCTAPVKFQYANFKNEAYNRSGNGSLRLQLINQRSDFSFALFSGGFSTVGFHHIVPFSRSFREAKTFLLTKFSHCFDRS